MANPNPPAVWVPLPHTAHSESTVTCRTCGWSGYGPGDATDRERGQQHATEYRGHVVLLAESIVSLCVAPDVVFVINRPG